MRYSPAKGPISQLRDRAEHIRDLAAAARMPSVTDELTELALGYDDIAATTLARAGTARVTMSDVPTGELIPPAKEGPSLSETSVTARPFSSAWQPVSTATF